jgi:hypothetical protein
MITALRILFLRWIIGSEEERLKRLEKNYAAEMTNIHTWLMEKRRLLEDLETHSRYVRLTRGTK